MEREIRITNDGSKTIYLPKWDESYHSKHGAIQEALHVYISQGLKPLLNHEEIHVLEFGFGTGLNAFLTLLEAKKYAKKINYSGIDYFPIPDEEWRSLDYFNASVSKYPSHTGESNQLYSAFLKLHESPWGEITSITETFSLLKQKMDFLHVELPLNYYNLVYFDCFGPRVQPELWTETIFRKVYTSIKEGGVLTTYSCKGSVRRNMESVGFAVDKKPGPPGKREMLVAIK